MKRRRMYLIKRPDSSNWWFKLRTRADVIGKLRGRKILLHLSRASDTPLTVVPTIGEFITFSVQTDDDQLAGSRERNALDHLEKLFAVTAAAPSSISHKDMVALSKTAYDLYIEIYYDEPGSNFQWAAHKALSRAALEGRISNPPQAIPGHAKADERLARELFGENLTAGIDAMEAGQFSDALDLRFGLIADWVLIHHQLSLTPDDRTRFLKLVATASIQSNWTLKRASIGDYSPDPEIERFPSTDTVKALRPKVTITDLFDGWWKEAKAIGRAENTRRGYKGSIDRLIEHLGHDDASRVTESDLLAFKDKRLAVVDAKTFVDSDVPGLRSIFAWGKTNRKIALSPIPDFNIKLAKRKSLRPKGFTDAEATAIFDACLSYTAQPKEAATTAAAKRWGPIVAAYTGARISEVLQLRKEDIFKDSSKDVLRITPEAGTVKTGQFRLVPIHSHLVDLGFLKFVKESTDGPLFAKGSYKRVVDFVRTVVTDPNVQPNHGWRHRYKTICRNLGFDPRVVDAIQGHAPKSASDDYGDVSVVAMARVMAKIPRIKTQADRKKRSKPRG